MTPPDPKANERPMKKVVSCNVKTGLTGRSWYYLGTLECGHEFMKSCRWNRREYVPGKPVRVKCRRCTALPRAVELEGKESK